MATTSVFATVGTTQFDKFIKHLTSSKVLKILHSKGYTHLTVQIGKGTFIPATGERDGVHVSYYRFKDSIADDMRSADLVLSHAGAGSCLEALEAGKSLVVVVNQDLMDNHQTELAEQLAKEGYLFYCNCDTLASTLKTVDFSGLSPYVKGEPNKFAEYLDSVMNFV